MPRIVLVIGTLQSGGAERQLSGMANHWARKGWKVTLVTWSSPSVPDYYALDGGVERVWIGAQGSGDSLIATLWSSVTGIRQLRRLLRAWRPQAVLSFIDISNVQTILAARGLRARVVVAERTHPGLNRTISRPWRALRRVLYAHADLVVAQTRHVASWIEEHCRAKAEVIPNALRALPQAAGDREPLVIAVGRLSREKGFDLLMEAFARLADRFPDWRLSILGAGVEREALLEQRRLLHLESRVEFAGHVADVEGWMARASVLVHPSRREGFPNVVLEAMGMGTAVIMTDCHAGTAELVRDGINGRLVPVDDLDALTRAMEALMASDELRERLGQEAIRVREQYGQEVVMRRWEECLLPGVS